MQPGSVSDAILGATPVKYCIHGMLRWHTLNSEFACALANILVDLGGCAAVGQALLLVGSKTDVIRGI